MLIENFKMEEIFEAKEFAKAIKEKKDEVFFIGQDKYTALVSRKKKVPFLGKISSRTQIYTSAKDEKFLEKVLEKMKQDGVTYSRIGNTMFGLKNKPNFVLDGLNFIERFTFVLDLKKSKDELWNKLDKKSRNAVRKAEKEGIIVKKIEDEEELNEYYRLALLNEKRISKKRSSFMLNPKSFFEYVFKEMVSKKMATFFIAKDENRIIAGALFFHTGKKIIYYHGCSLREYSNNRHQARFSGNLFYMQKKKSMKFMILAVVPRI